jgi:chromosome segregation ATPase
MPTQPPPTLNWALLALLLAALAAPAWAQEDPRASREREMLRRVQQQLQTTQQQLQGTQQQLQAAQQALQAAQAAQAGLDADVQRWRSRARADATRSGQLQQELQAQTAQRDALAAERDTLRRQGEEQAAQLRAAAQRQAQLERELAQAREQARSLDTHLGAQREATSACEQRNAALYQSGRELIEQCRDRSAVDALLRLEPFTGQRRVAIENMLEAQRDRLDEQRIAPAAPRP